ncbi:MAG: hypothetical protein RIQ93_561 [Verrucomicrobiota bacterium]|jgi:VanZ family protein
MPYSFRNFRGAVWPLAMAALIFLASSRSHVAGPAIPGLDKVVHFSIYALLATLVCRLGRGRRGAVLSLLIVSVFGVTDEWHQSFVPGRRAEFADWVADTLGALVAIALYYGWEKYRRVLEHTVASREVAPARKLGPG